MSKAYTLPKGRPTPKRDKAVEARRALIQRAAEEGEKFRDRLAKRPTLKAVPKHTPVTAEDLELRDLPSVPHAYDEMREDLMTAGEPVASPSSYRIKQGDDGVVEIYQPEEPKRPDAGETVPYVIEPEPERELFTIEQYLPKSKRHELEMADNFDFWVGERAEPGRYRLKGADGVVLRTLSRTIE